jgi:two-component system, chemotaxis family, chemotaxis protein CheY
MAVAPRIVIADAGRHTRTMICDILRSAGYRDLTPAASEADLRMLVDQLRPKIVVMAADFPGLSGLNFAKLVRTGLNFVPRETSVILTTSTPTRSFLEAARAVGVDEVVAVPFTTQTLVARILSVVERPRPFVDCPTYVGPCRRRVMLQDYKGPLRRTVDPEKLPEAGPLWSTESNRSAVRMCVQKMSEYRKELAPEQYTKLRQVYHSVLNIETRSHQEDDEALGDAARSFGCYISTLQQEDGIDVALLSQHIDAIHLLALGRETEADQRRALVAGLQQSVRASSSREREG